MRDPLLICHRLSLRLELVCGFSAEGTCLSTGYPMLSPERLLILKRVSARGRFGWAFAPRATHRSRNEIFRRRSWRLSALKGGAGGPRAERKLTSSRNAAGR